MGSFSIDFPDEDVFGILGDELTVVSPTGGVEVVVAPFEVIDDSDELVNRVDANDPVIPIMNKDAHLFVKGVIVKFNGKEYSYQTKNPYDANLYLVELRTKIKR